MHYQLECTAQPLLEDLTQYFLEYGADFDVSRSQAMTAIGHIARRETLVMTYNDIFYLMGAAFLVSLLLVFLLKKDR